MANAVIHALAVEPQRYNRLLELLGLTPGLLTAAGRALAQGRVGTPG